MIGEKQVAEATDSSESRRRSLPLEADTKKRLLKTLYVPQLVIFGMRKSKGLSLIFVVRLCECSINAITNRSHGRVAVTVGQPLGAAPTL
jgi:hypothetical protein